MRAGIVGWALMLAGCGHLPGHKVATGGETITYSLSAAGLCLQCSSYTITMGPDGQGIVAGGRNAAMGGDHRFTATPDQQRAFSAALRVYRPTGEVLMTGTPFCKQLATDDDSVDIRWTPAVGPSRHLVFYGGCDMARNRKMAAALFSAPTLLPIADLIGHR